MSPRCCTVCTNESREAIDHALVAGEPFRRIAARFTGTSETSLRRYKAGHLPVTMLKAQQAAEVLDADRLLQQTHELQQKASGILDMATGGERPNLQAANGAVREARNILELMGRLLGVLTNGGVAVNVQASAGAVAYTPEAAGEARQKLAAKLEAIHAAAQLSAGDSPR